MMLRHGLDRPDDAERVEAAVDSVLESGLRTVDLAAAGESTVGTIEMTDAVLAEMAGKVP
jgi:3-isopropylmalate dehydrogenase